MHIRDSATSQDKPPFNREFLWPVAIAYAFRNLHVGESYEGYFSADDGSRI